MTPSRDEDPTQEHPDSLKAGRGLDSVGHGLVRNWAHLAEELTGDWTLQGCARMEFAGAPRPCLGHYPLLARIGQGAMGVVYYAAHPRLGTEVAIKILPRHLYERQPGLLRRFVREAQLSARLESDHLVRVIDVDQDRASDLYFLVMEFVRGVSASRWAADVRSSGVRVTEADALTICEAATRGLSAAHEQGTIHRDVKPENILIPKQGDTPLLRASKLADLGIACPDEETQQGGERLTGASVSLVGTPGFAAPEQLKDPRKVKKPADVFSMGATLYALLTSETPFDRGSPMPTVLATLKGEAKHLRDHRADITPTTTALIETCLRPNPDDRYPDAFALLDALRLCRTGAGKLSAEASTTEVVRLAERTELGAAVQTDMATNAAELVGFLCLSGGPGGARVLVRRLGDQPISYAAVLDARGHFERDHVESGSYQLAATCQGYHPFATTFELPGGGSAVVRVAMRERDGTLSVASRPEGAEVFLDGAAVGTTPLVALSIPPGPHSVMLVATGFDTIVRPVEVRGGEACDLGVIDLVAFGWIDLAHFDDGIRFELGGRAAQGRVEVSPGVYSVAASREGQESQVVEVRVDAHATVTPVLGPWRRHGWSLVSDLGRWDTTTTSDRRRVAKSIAKAAKLDFRGLESFEAGGARHEVALFVHPATAMEFVLVPGGTTVVGAPTGERGRRPDERRREAVVEPILLARTPVTQLLWTRTMGSNPSRFHGSDLPVEQVTWTEAALFCERLGLVLPSEAQWEHGCRAATLSAHCAGDDAAALAAHGWFVANSDGRTRPVASRAANPLGLFDMHGNVWEWCADPYQEDPSRAPELVPDVPGARPRYRVFRGGSWSDPASDLRSARRGAYRPDHRSDGLGLRPAFQITREMLAEPSSSVETVTVPVTGPVEGRGAAQ